MIFSKNVYRNLRVAHAQVSEVRSSVVEKFKSLALAFGSLAAVLSTKRGFSRSVLSRDLLESHSGQS